MIKKYSKLHVAKQDFTNETWEEFSQRHNLIWDRNILSDLDKDFWKLFRGGEPAYDDFAEAYFDAIPKIYKKKAFPRNLIREYVELEGTDDKEDKALYTRLYSKIAEEIEAAVNRDKETWNKVPTLPGLNPRGRKPGAPNKVQESHTGLPILDVKEINDYTNRLTGASHKDIEQTLQELFPVSEEESEAYFNAEDIQDLTPQKEALIILSWIYQANIEVAAKEGDPGEVKDLLKAMNRARKLPVADIMSLYEAQQNQKPYKIPEQDISGEIN